MMVIISIILLNLLWFASVLGAANQLIWPAFLVLFVLLVVSFIYEDIDRKDAKVILFSLFFGILCDGFLNVSGLVIYNNVLFNFEVLPPIWIMLLWIGFGVSIKSGLQWLLNAPMLGALFMAVGAPLSYYSASQLNAVKFSDTLEAMTVVGVAWLLYFVGIVYIKNTKEGKNNALV